MPYRVLLVEDEIGLRVGLEDSLRIAGYEVDTADDGEDALRLASAGGFDAILLDLILPLKDGVTVCVHILSLDSQAPSLVQHAARRAFTLPCTFVAHANHILSPGSHQVGTLRAAASLRSEVFTMNRYQRSQ